MEREVKTETKKFNRKLADLYNEHKQEVEERAKRTKLSEEEWEKKKKELEEKYKILEKEEQDNFNKQILIMEDKLNKAIEERDRLTKEKEEKEEERKEVKTKDVMKVKTLTPPTLPPKPELVPTVKKPKKPEVPHQKMELNKQVNKNPTTMDEIVYWIMMPTLKLIRIFPWLLRTFSEASLQIISWSIILFMIYFVYYIINKWRIL